MLLDIELIQTTDMSCFDKACASVARYWNREYEMIFSGMWDFNLLPADPKFTLNIGIRINCDISNQIELLKTYHGIQLTENVINTASGAVAAIQNEIVNNRPVFMQFDQYYFPWASEQERTVDRYRGIILITGFDMEHKTFICLDLHGTKKMELLPEINFIQGMDSLKGICRYYSFRLLDGYKKCNWTEFAQNTAARLKQLKKNNLNAFDSIRACARLIRKELDFSIEVPADAKADIRLVNHVPIINNVKKIVGNRNLFLMTLDSFDKSNRHKPFIELYKWSIAPWKYAAGMLIKAYYARDYSDNLRNKLADYFEEACDREEALIEKMPDTPGSNSTDIEKLHNNTESTADSNAYVKTEYINLADIMNNKAFSSSFENPFSADLTGSRIFFLANGSYINIWECNNMRFHMEFSESSKNDNVICMAQNIGIVPDRYNTIMILGCSEFSDCAGKLQIEHSHNQVEEIEIELPNFKYPNGVYAWDGESIMSTDSGVTYRGKGYLFAKSYRLKKDVDIIGIRLPDCCLMHIFAISLGLAV